MLTILHINGSLLPDAVFIDGDDHDAPDQAPLPVRIEAALCRIEAEIANASEGCLIVAYPLDQVHFERLRAVADRGEARFLVLTLAPPLEVALMDRGTRRLSAEERRRIVEMYGEGYQDRSFSDLVLDTSRLTVQETAEKAWALLSYQRS
jgi:hypothetical protein